MSYYLLLIELGPECHLCSELKEHILHIPYQSQCENSTPDTIAVMHLACLSGQCNTIKTSVSLSLSYFVPYTHT